jgi:amino acid adenylation domain-containing protein
VEKLVVKRDKSRNPLFDVMFQVGGISNPKMEIKGLKTGLYGYRTKISKFDLTLTTTEKGDHLYCSFEYGTKLFKPAAITRFIEYFKGICTSVAAHPEQKIAKIRSISGKRKREILRQLNRGLADEKKRIKESGQWQTLQYRLNDTLEKFQDKIAVEYSNCALTYGELYKRSGRIARRIIQKGIKKGTFLGVLSENRLMLILVMLGILETGCVFIPLEPSHPRERLELMINTTNVDFLFTDTSNFSTFSSGNDNKQQKVELLPLDDWLAIEDNEVTPPLPALPPIAYHPEDEIYIYFTSGSTGTPKALLGKNSSLVHFIDWEIDTFEIDEGYRFSQLSAPGFDAFLRDTLVPLCCGGTICIPEGKEIILNSDRFLHWLERSRIQLISCVPSLFRVLTGGTLTRERFPELKAILFSGERITASDLSGWLEIFDHRIRLVNLWGTSETTLAKTAHFICKSDLQRERIPVGKPIRGAGILVMDQQGELCEPLVTGELYIRTPFRSFGYYNDTQSNSEKFVKNPYSDDKTDLIHKTGDIGRILLDGTIDLLGRNDRQVKIHGIRVELEEIENVLNKYPLVKEVAVVKKELSPHNEMLCAYVTVKPENLDSIEESALIDTIKQYLSVKLPDYMVPAHIKILGSLPRTPTGKVDYQELPDPIAEKDTGLVPPANQVEQKILDIWSDILKIKAISINTNFFEVGGNSLNLMSLIARIHKTFDVRITLGEIFNHPTIRQQAEIIMETGNEKYASIEALEERKYYPVSYAQRRIWALSQITRASRSFNMPMAYILEGELNPQAFNKAFVMLVERHESLRTIFISLNGEIYQEVVHVNKVNFKVNYIDLSDYKGIEKEKKVKDLSILDANTLFDLSTGPLLRTTLIQMEEKKYIFLFTLHHIVSDYLSLQLLASEIFNLYGAFEKGKEDTLKPLRIHYKDYAAWQNKNLSGEYLKKLQTYWLHRFKKEIPQMELPSDKKRPDFRTYKGDTAVFNIDETLTGQLKSLGELYGTTLFMTLLASVNVLLYHYSGCEDIVIGIPIANRPHLELENQIGFYLNTLALRTSFDAKEPFTELLNKVKEVVLGAFEHQDYPFDKLVEDLGGKRDIRRHPLFEVVIDMQNYTHSLEHRPFQGDLEIYPQATGLKSSKFDLALYVQEDKRTIPISFEYNTDIFQRETILCLIERFKILLESITAKPGTVVADFQLQGEVEMPRLEPRPGAGSQLAEAAGVKASSHQERLWFIDQFESGNLYDASPLYHNIPIILEIEGLIDPGILEHSFCSLIKRHEVLRTRIINESNKTVQWITPDISFHLEVIDLWDKENKQGNTEIDLMGLCMERVKRPFNMDKDLLIRASLVCSAANQAVLAIGIHHVIADRYSLSLMVKELMEYYEAYVRRTSPGLPVQPLHYADFSLWQHQFPARVIDRLLFYWRRQLSSPPESLELPTDQPRAAIHLFADASQAFSFSPPLTAAIKHFSREKGVTPFVVLLSALYVLFHRYTHQEDIVIGTSVDNRTQPGTGNIIGPIANLLALRTLISSTTDFDSLLTRVNKTVNNSLLNREMPFDQLVAALAPGKDMSRTALFDVLFQYETNPITTFSARNLSLHLHVKETNLGWGKYDLNFLVQETADGFSGIIVYNKRYYHQSTISRLLGHYCLLLEGMLENPLQPIFQVPLLTPAEKHQLVIQWNQMQAGYPRDKFLHQLFQEQSNQTPDHIALVCGEGTDSTPFITCLTYRELNNKSNQLASRLKQKGVGPDTLVPIMVERGEWMIIGILGILMAGGAYVPIDPYYPEERKQYILRDIGPNLIVTDKELNLSNGAPGEETAPGESPQKLLIKSFLEMETATFPKSTLNTGSKNIAYVIYTSGTTGYPKGCMLTHENVVRLFKNDKHPFDFGTRDVWVMFHSFCFDFSVWEMYGALLNGGRLVIPGWLGTRDYSIFLSILKRQNVTVLNQTPLSFYHLVEEEKRSFTGILAHHLRYVIFGGDRLCPSYLQDWVQRYSPADISLVNMYGITETTVHVTYYSIKEEDIFSPGQSSPIGSAIPETTIYIFDRHLNLVPVGVTGEIYVGGSGVCRGYLNRVVLTWERFIDNPIGQREILYKSGDLGRWLPEGDIQYLGRNDDQVKIRGYRIELGEIQHRLSNHEHIKEIVVTVSQNPRAEGDNEKEDQYLCAYFVADINLSIQELKTFLSRDLPDYMIPQYFMQLEKIPLTSNGKVDLGLLPEPVPQAATYFAPPRNRLEKKLVKIWAEVLKQDQHNISINANFFEIGGQSLNATTLTARIHKELNVKLPLAEIFIRPQLKELAEYIGKLVEDKYESLRPTSQKEYYALSSAQRRLYIIQGMAPESTAYNMLELFELDEIPNEQKLLHTFEQLIQRHESLRTSFKIVEGIPMQIIHPRVTSEIVFYELDPGIRNNEEAKEVTKIAMEFIKPFDLSRAPLLRLGLIKITGNRYVLMVDMHHIISDGISQALLANDYMMLYTGKESPPLKLQYKDYAEWQNCEKVKEHLKQQKEYWIKEFSSRGEIPVLNIPIDYPRPGVRDFEGGAVTFAIEGEAAAALRKLFASEGITMFMGLSAVIGIFLSKICSQEDILIGAPIAARRHADLGKIIGMFVNTLVLRHYPSGGKTVKEFLAEVKAWTLKAFENQEYPFEDLVDQLEIQRDVSRNPLFDVMLTLENQDAGTTDMDREEKPPVNLKRYQMKTDTGTAKFDLTLNASEIEEKLAITIVYCRKLFKRETIQRFISILKKIVAAISENPGKKIWGIEITGEDERKQLLYRFNDTEGTVDLKGMLLDELFEARVRQFPDHIAVVGFEELHDPLAADVGTSLDDHGSAPSFNEPHFTYHELNQRANRLAHFLAGKGIKNNTIAALMVERSIEMIIGLLGILRAGGAYLPIDPAYPEERIRYILADSSTKIMVSTGSTVKKVGRNGESLELILIEEALAYFTPLPTQQLEQISAAPPILHNKYNQCPPKNYSHQSAYVIYTSGTTGKPKGVLVRHRGVVNLVAVHQKLFGENPDARISQVASPAFDAMALEVWPCLCSGAALYIATTEARLEPSKMKSWLIQKEITHSFQSTVIARQLLDQEWPGKGIALKSLRTGGEKLTYYPTRQYPFTFYNLYGPTEDSIWTTWTEVKVESNPEKYPGIGKPMDNHHVYILSTHMQLQPVGIPGELSITGVGLAAGYLNQPELTCERFINFKAAVPGKNIPPGHMPGVTNQGNLTPPLYCPLYKTGDIARWEPDGSLEFLGRIDSQVKIRGFRIELEEIAGQLLRHGSIKDAVVMVTGESSENKLLSAYIVLANEVPISQLREHLSKILPEYMIPAQFFHLEQIPLTPGGKVDRRALISSGKKLKTDSQYEAPISDREKIVATAWKEVLQLNTVGIHDNFFEVGGNSMNIFQLNFKLKEALNMDIPIMTLFRYPTISSLVKFLNQDKSTEEKTGTASKEELKKFADSLLDGLKVFGDR